MMLLANTKLTISDPEASPSAIAVPEMPSPYAGNDSVFNSMPAWLRYAIDLAQRGAIFQQALVERGDTLLDDEQRGLVRRACR